MRDMQSIKILRVSVAWKSHLTKCFVTNHDIFLENPQVYMINGTEIIKYLHLHTFKVISLRINKLDSVTYDITKP